MRGEFVRQTVVLAPDMGNCESVQLLDQSLDNRGQPAQGFVLDLILPQHLPDQKLAVTEDVNLFPTPSERAQKAVAKRFVLGDIVGRLFVEQPADLPKNVSLHVGEDDSNRSGAGVTVRRAINKHLDPLGRTVRAGGRRIGGENLFGVGQGDLGLGGQIAAQLFFEFAKQPAERGKSLAEFGVVNAWQTIGNRADVAIGLGQHVNDSRQRNAGLGQSQRGFCQFGQFGWKSFPHREGSVKCLPRQGQ